MAFDFKKEYKELYAPKKVPGIIACNRLIRGLHTTTRIGYEHADRL